MLSSELNKLKKNFFATTIGMEVIEQSTILLFNFKKVIDEEEWRASMVS